MATFLGILRPSGALGDASDATYESQSDSGVVATLAFSWGALSGSIMGTVEFLRFFARIRATPDEQGPNSPTCGPRWRLGAAGTVASYTEAVGFETGLPRNIQSGDITLDPDGAAWVAGTVATLQMAAVATTDPGGTQIATTVVVYDVWAEAWGTPSAGADEAVVHVTGEAGSVSAGGDAGPMALSGLAGTITTGGKV